MDQDKLPDGALAAPLLSRMDLVGLEAVICAGLREIFPFSAHSFYFPRPALAGETPADTAEYLARERKLLLPLRQPGGEFLGFFVARLPRGVKIRPLLPALPALAGLCLDKAALFRQTLRDPITGLHHRQALLTAVAAELERLSRIIASSERSSLRPTAPWLEYELKNSSGRSAGEFSLLIFRLDGLDELARRHGHLRVEELLAMLGRTLEKLQPGQGFSARSGEDELALLLPGEGPLAGRELGLRLAEKLAGIENRDALTGRICRARISLGQTRVPLDLRGLEGLSPAEQARRLLRRGRLAADLAADSALPALAYADILHEGGRVLESRPFSRVLISLGSEAGAKPGQGFTVWEADGDRHPVYKADLLLLATEENNSLAEVLHLDDPASPPLPGDRLRLAGQEQNDPRHVLPADFLRHWSREREKCPASALVLGRFVPLQPPPPPLPHPEDSVEPDRPARSPEDLLGRAADRCREMFGQDLLLGRYAMNSLIFFVPSSSDDPENFARILSERLETLSRALELDLGLESAFGLAQHPFLDFHPADGLENARKALRYALLLPRPHLGRLDSLALNINADRLLHLGGVEHTLEAIAEYRRSLLCDPDNIPAWNSLGLALAGMGQKEEARRGLEEALRRSPDDFNTLYNLGTLAQNLDSPSAAGRYFQRCLELDAGNVFVLHRLGWLAEEEGRPNEAARYYLQAGENPDGQGLARRGLARLALKKGDPQAAREALYEALIHDPHDALALQMLARLYLEAGEDPAVAESLARQSLALRPDLREAWLDLARALEAAGQKEAAGEALHRAGEL